MIKRDKKGQVTLFIVLAILLVSSVILLFYYWKPGLFRPGDSQPQLESCISNSLEQRIETLALSAGLIDPKFNYMYMGSNYTYLCYTDEYYLPCVNQEPFLTKAFEESLSNILLQEFQVCYDSSVDDLRARGYDVEQGDAQFEISIEPGYVSVKIDAPMTVSSGETSVATQKYNYRYRTNLYNLLMVATSLIQFETYYGDSEQMQQMFFYPEILIDKQRRDDDTKVYTLKEKEEGIEYRFAVKSFPYPAGGYI